MTTRTITYRGSAPYASMLVQMLEAEGVEVSWTRPEERRDLQGLAEAVVVDLVSTGTVGAIAYALGKFRERTKGRADVRVDPPLGDED